MIRQNARDNLSLIRHISQGASLLSVLIGVFVILGWALDITILKSVVSGFATMKPITAICFILCGAALWISFKENNLSNNKKSIAQVSAILVILISLLTFAEYILDSTIIDQLLFREKILAETTIYPGRMPLITAFNFFLLGISLIFLDFEIGRVFRPSQWFSLLIALICLVTIISYAYNVEEIYKIFPFSSIAIHTAATFFILSIGVLLARGNQGLTAIFFRKTPGSILINRLLPAAIIIPFVLGWLRLKGEQFGYYGTEFGVAMFATSNIVIFTFLIWRSAVLLDQTAAERKLTESQLRESNQDFRALVRATTQAVWESGENGRGAEISKWWENLTGQTLDDTHDWLEALHPEDREQASSAWKYALENKTLFDVEYRIKNIEGNYQYFAVRGVPVFNDDGVFRKWFGTFTDITSLKNAQAETFKLAAIVESSEDAIISKNFDGKILSWNKGAEKIFGYSAEEAVGENIEFLFPPKLLYKEAEIIEKIKRGEYISNEETVRQRKDGTEIPVALTISPIKDFQGKIIGISKIAQDITNRKLAEEALRKSEEHYRLLFENNPLPMWVYELETLKFIAVNEAAVSQYGYSQEEFLSMTIKDIRPDEDVPVLIKDIAENSQKPQDASIWKHRKKDGSIVYVEINSHELNLDGKQSRLVLANDLTERMKAEADLIQSEKRLRSTLDKMLEGVQIVDFDWKYLYVNEAFTKHGKYPEEELLGYTVMEKYPGIEKTEVYKVYQKCFNERVAIQMENKFLFPDNTTGWFELSFQPIPEGIFILSVDITERKQQEAEIQKLTETLENKVIERTAELDAVNKELAAFSYSVSHDLRAPLRAMDGFSLALLEDYEDRLDAEGQNFLQRIRVGSQQMARLIDDMLKLSRVTRAEIIKEKVNLSETVKAIFHKLQEHQPRESVSFDIEENIYAVGDEHLLRIALENLVGNSYKFTSKREDAKIIFGQKQKRGKTVYFVRDNGAGFNMAYADKLFGAFQRFHGAKDFEGTGIGLATVQRVINRHGGQIYAESKVGEGATFYFTIS